MKLCVLTVTVLLYIITVYAQKQDMLRANRTPKETLNRVALFTGTCDECKLVVKRFAEAMKNPKKVEELKRLLKILCHETTYEDECRLFVDQLDHFVDKLRPYLDHPDEVCKHLHLCQNRKIERFHFINVEYGKKNMDGNNAVKDLVCEECQFAAQELKHLIEDEKRQERIKRFISEEICSRLGSLQGKCDLMLEEFLPELIEELDKLLQNSKTFCIDLGLCKRSVKQFDDDIISDEEKQESVLKKFNF